MHGLSLYVYASVYMCLCMDQVYLYMRVFYVYMHGSSLFVYASVYMCICMDRVYMYMHGSSLYVYASVYRCICMDQVYMYMRMFICVYAWIEFNVYASVICVYA